MMKRILLLLMAACVALAANARKTIAEDVFIDSIYYNLYETESGQYEAEVGRARYWWYDNKSYVIPSKVTYLDVDFTVTGIGNNTFYDCKNLKEISLPNTIKAIGSSAFGSCGITSIDLRSVDSIGENAFYECTNLKTVIMPDSMRYIEQDAFERSGITSIDIPEGITRIEMNTFRECTNLEKVTLPESMGYIDWYAFGNCSSLKEINLPQNIYMISKGAFEGCTSLPNKIILPPNCDTREDAFNGCTSVDFVIYTNNSFGSIVEIEKEFPMRGKATVYVPRWNKESDKPENVVEMITWTFNGSPQNKFTYTAECPNLGYINNMEDIGFAVEMELPSTQKTVGVWRDTTLATFTNGDTTFTVRIPLEYEIERSPLTITALDTTCVYGDGVGKLVYDGFIAECDTAWIKDSIRTEVYDPWSSPQWIDISTARVGVWKYGVPGFRIPQYVEEKYHIINKHGTLTVTKAPLTVNVNAYAYYGHVERDYIYYSAVEYDGLKNGETKPEFVDEESYHEYKAVSAMKFDVKETSQVGEYPLISYNEELWEMENYEPTITGSFTVKKASLTISCGPLTKLYGQDNPILRYKTIGFVNGDDKSVLNIIETPTFSTTATKESPAGRYPIKLESGKVEAKNYEISYQGGTLTIEKRDLHVSVGDYTRKYGEENPEFELSYSGFINDETEDVLSDLPIAATAATRESEVGEYEINITGGEAANYNILKEGGVLTIEKADQTLLWEQDLSNITIGSQVELTATASSGLPVEYVVDDNDFLSIYIVDEKSFLDCYDYGEIVLRAIQNGNQNFNPIRASKRVIIGDGGETSGTDVADEDAVGVYSHDGTIYIVNKPVDETVSVYTPAGVQVYDGVDSEIEAESGIYILKTCGGVWKIMVR